MFSRLHLVLLWLLFAGWVGWIYWQSHQHGRFPIVSRAQLLSADVAVVGRIEALPDGRPVPKVKVASVVWPAKADDKLVGRELDVANLAGSSGFTEAGNYLVILSGSGEGPFRLAEVPRSPLVDPRVRPAVYPDRPDVIEQLRDIPGPSARSNN